jgi:hypothetical protein
MLWRRKGAIPFLNSSVETTLREVALSDTSTRTIIARFETRDAAELAVEHLSQEQGIDRTDIFLKASR